MEYSYNRQPTGIKLCYPTDSAWCIVTWNLDNCCTALQKITFKNACSRWM